MTAKMPKPFGYFCDWGDSSSGLQRIAMYYGEPGNGVDNDWNEHPRVHKNLPLIPTEQAESYAQARVNEALDLLADKASQKYLMPEFSAAIRALKGEQT